MVNLFGEIKMIEGNWQQLKKRHMRDDMAGKICRLKFFIVKSSQSRYFQIQIPQVFTRRAGFIAGDKLEIFLKHGQVKIVRSTAQKDTYSLNGSKYVRVVYKDDIGELLGYKYTADETVFLDAKSVHVGSGSIQFNVELPEQKLTVPPENDCNEIPF
jgi:hypothetical protein